MALSCGACGLDELQPGAAGVLLIAPSDADDTTLRMVDEAARYLETIAGDTPQIAAVASGRFDDVVRRAGDRGAGLVLVFDAERIASDEIGQDRIDDLGESGFVLQTEDAGGWTNRLGSEGATFMMMAAETTLSRQYATYEALRRLGVRFYHPEQEFVPTHALDDLRELAKRPTAIYRGSDDYIADFGWRSWNFHSAHPLEHLESFSDAGHPIDEARRVNLWQVKNFGNRFRGAGRGIASDESRAQRREELEAMRDELGFPRGTGITLHNQQQGANADIDPTSDTPVREQIEALVDERLAALPDSRWFGIHFGPTEFSTTDAIPTVDWINWAGQRALELNPDIEVEINDHITGFQPMAEFDDLGCPNGTNPDGHVDYYDLAFHTDPRLGVRVHTVMFYPLEGPARVYNQHSFAHKRCLMEKASAEGRQVGWFPEGSWWLSFDNPIPVYLPLHVWTRARDVELLKPLLASRGGGTLKDHRMFNSGQEWGYWQQDYAVGLLGWNADVTNDEIWTEMLEPLCEAADWRDGCPVRAEVLNIVTELVDHQRDTFLTRPDWQGRPGGLYTYFAGEDQGDILASDGGFEFRPVRVAFRDVLEWDREQLEHFRDTDLAAINEIAIAYAGWRDRMIKARSFVAKHGLAWFDEIADGIEINEMRARQAAALYTSILAVRDAQLDNAADPEAAGEGQYGAAQMALAQAEIVIRRREAAYRYPAAQTYGGGLTPETAVANGTTYPYRVHTKTHLLTYWTNRDTEVRAILDGMAVGDGSVQMLPAIDEPGTSVEIAWPDTMSVNGSVSLGDAIVVDPSVATVDLGDDSGIWPVSGELVADNPFIDISGAIVRSSVRAMTPAQGLEFTIPAQEAAQSALAAVFPSMQWAWVDEPETLAFAVDEDADGTVDFRRVVTASIVSRDGDAFQTEVTAFSIPIGTSGGGFVEVKVTEVVLSGTVTEGALVDPVRVVGNLHIADLVQALVVLGAFDEAGSLAALASLLGFDPQAPPETVPVDAAIELQPVAP